MTPKTPPRWPAPAAAALAVLYVAWTQAELGGTAVTVAFSDPIIGLAAAAPDWRAWPRPGGRRVGRAAAGH